MENVKFGTHLLHADTTSVSVHEEYEHPDGSPAIEITYGHSKDNRPDLKQFVVSMITNQHGIPLFAKTYFGTKSDKQGLIESFTDSDFIRLKNDPSVNLLYSNDEFGVWNIAIP
jgi:transposase